MKTSRAWTQAARSIASPRDLILGLSPFEQPDPRLVLALGRAGALGVLDLGRDAAAGREALARVGRERGRFGVRVPEATAWQPADLPAAIEVVVITAADVAGLGAWRPRAVLVQVTSIEEARAAVAAGADGLIAKGAEAGGRIGAETAFVLLQRLVGESALPIWVQGGVGVHTAAACIAGGAVGVVLDAQLALVRESSVPESVKAAIRRMDGSETTVIGDHRLFTRPDLPVARLRDAEREPAAIRVRLGAADIEQSLVPVGQDAAFAPGLAARFRTVGGLVQGLRDEIDEHLRQAALHRPLDADSPLAADHGIRYPIAQGPMTRVSDRAAFADAVARGGGLPFLALALMKGDEIREILRETSEQLGDRPWGVGILGFVPESVREEQLAVVREFRPSAAIIAGGRPSQLAPLEQHGTKTYLHVPSPGLLDLFLADGARSFVFEGRECGGHVGPRTSFVLWELQIERLLAVPEPRELRVLFAGGIHDARSAAMVAAMAAPLAARGARVGVLMGTAYLFTEEAVTSGAIQPGFQEAALGCETTVLLETAPGHATRCVETEYVRAFAEQKHRLEEQKLPSEEIWARLEQLNLGRLRIAAKGLERRGSAIVAVDPATQARDGMYMIGQIAALRRQTLSIAALHRDVCEGATARIAELALGQSPRAVAAPPAPADVAVIGIACIFPDAPDRQTFWANILAAKSSMIEVPTDRWDSDVYYDAASQGGEKTNSKWGGFLPQIRFDPLAYGIPPKSVIAIEPVQLLSLEVARRALDDAGYGKDRVFDRERTSVIFGAEAGTELSSAYGFRAFFPQYAGDIPPALDELLPKLTEDSFPGVLANVIAGRIANRLDLGGVNYTVDAACAASLAALDLAVKELTTGTSDMVLCGGADLHNSINDYLLFSSVHALSPTGACRTFDAAADGIALGEGVACVVLKRLADAERDGDRIYAVVEGVAGSSDGRSLGLTAPRKEGQMRALERAYRAAGVSPLDVGLVEAHGTGTVVGDRTELATLTEVYGAAGAKPGSVVLGSVKSQIGHTKCAAGLAGLVKVALALHHRVLPPTLNIRSPNPAYDAAKSPFVFHDAARPWPSEQRRAAVSAFGFGGTNFHAVLASYDTAEPAKSGEVWPAELFMFRTPRARSGEPSDGRASLLAQIARLESRLDDPTLRLADLARSVSERRRRDDGEVEVALVARSIDDLRDKLSCARDRVEGRAAAGDVAGVYVRDAAAGAPGRVAFLFSGQGSQRPGMLADVFVAFPALQRFLAMGAPWASRIFPPLAFTPEARAAQARAITDTRVAQPALGIVELALSELFRSLGVKPDLLAGHSYGELAALAYAGAIGERELLALSEARAECILAAAGDGDPGTMAAASAAPRDVLPHLEGLESVVIANHNAPEQTVISGPTAGVERALSRLEAAGIAARTIAVACAFHSPVIAGARELFAARLADVALAPPRMPVFSNATVREYPADAGEVRRMLAEHVALPVRFCEQIEAMYAAGARIFVEIGPGRVLTGLVGRILAGEPHLALACDQSGEPGVEQLLRAVAQLAIAGVAIDATALYAGREARVVDLDAPTPAVSPSTWLVNGHLARPISGEIPPGALRPVVAPVVAPFMPAMPTGNHESAVIEYLRSTREIIEAQRQVMLGLLGEELPDEADTTVDGRAGYPSVPPMPSFSPPPAGRPGAPARQVALPRGSVRASAPPSARAAAGSVPPQARAPRAPRLPSESAAWMRDASAAGAAPVGAAGPAANVSDALLAIVSERTGYPIEMLDLDLNLEAELGIDSIKRIEIFGKLGKQFGFGAQSGASRDEVIEKLAALKTLRSIVDLLENGPTPVPGAPAVAVASSVPPQPGPSGVRADTTAGTRSEIRRYVLAIEDAPIQAAPRSLAGRSYVVIPDGGGLAAEVVQKLVARGASARLLDGAAIDKCDGIVDLSALTPGAGAETTRALFDHVQRAALGGATTAIALLPVGAPFAAEHERPRPGVAGLLKTLAKEVRGMLARAVEVDPREDKAKLTEIVLAEIACDDGNREVAWVGGVRRTLRPVAADLIRGRAPGGVAAAARRVGPNAVVVVTGGARGITATVAIALAKRFQCRLEIVGRTPLPDGPEDPDLALALDLPALRKAIVAQHAAGAPGSTAEPLAFAAIEARAASVLTARAIRDTLKKIADAGSSVDYHAVDVRDERAFGALLDDLYAQHGRIDGVVHGAGVVEDKLLAHKTRESFDRVFDTKVKGATTLAAKLRKDVGFVVFFGSVSGTFGNKGQIDYSAANDALDKLAWWLDERVDGRVFAIDWGPWGGHGMVSPELAREYARRGVGLIEPSAGIDGFLDELLEDASPPQIVLMSASSSPAAFEGRAEEAAPGAESHTAASVDAADAVDA